MAKTELLYVPQKWISNKMNTRHPGQLKILRQFWNYQLNRTANPAHLPQNWSKLAKSANNYKIHT